MTAPSRESWRSRIVGHGEEAPDQLLANPLNFRIHPKPQQDALAGVLDEVGWVQDVIVNRQTGHVIDGHLRVSLAISRDEPMVPVVYVDLDEHEEKLILATIDPLSAMAATDAEKLDELLHEVSTGDAAVQAMLAGLAQDAGVVPGVPEPSAQVEPILASECLIEIRCSRRDLSEFQAALDEWQERPSVSIDIS